MPTNLQFWNTGEDGSYYMPMPPVKGFEGADARLLLYRIEILGKKHLPSVPQRIETHCDNGNNRFRRCGSARGRLQYDCIL